MEALKNIIYAHEHITIDLSGPKKNEDCRLDSFDDVVVEFHTLAQLGVTKVVDQTNRGMGRNVLYTNKVAAETGITITHATGYYKEPFLPEECYRLSSKEMANIMIKELCQGIGDTGVRASIIGEIGSSKDEITPIERKIFKAGSIAHLETGAPICTHTTLGTAGLDQIAIFKEYKVDLAKVVLSHVALSGDLDYMLRLVDNGVNIAFDTVGKLAYESDENRANWIYEIVKRGYGDQIVASVDITRKSHYKKNGGIGYDYLLTTFVPMLIEKGCTYTQLEKILCKNPERIYGK